MQKIKIGNKISKGGDINKITSIAIRLLFIKNKHAGSIESTNAHINRLFRFGSVSSFVTSWTCDARIYDTES